MATAQGTVVEISPRALARLLAEGERLTLLDVREPVERAHCAIPTHVSVVDLHIPVSQIVANLDVLRDACMEGPTVVYCHHGVRSRLVADWLAQQGLSGLMNLGGGIDAWSVEVDPFVPRYT